MKIQDTEQITMSFIKIIYLIIEFRKYLRSLLQSFNQITTGAEPFFVFSIEQNKILL